MRKLLLGAAAISLSGCSFLGFGSSAPKYGHSAASYSTPTSSCGAHHAVLANGNCLSRINLEGGIGTTYHVDGNAFEGSGVNTPGFALGDFEWDDAYDRGTRYELGGSYAMSPSTKISAMAHIEEADSSGVVGLGTVNGQAVTGALSDFRQTGVELGLRKYFNPTPAPFVRSVRPYVEGRVGAAYQDGITINSFTVGGNNAGNVNLTESGWVPSAAGLVGLETPLTRYSTIGLETGLRYTGSADRSTSLNGTPFQGMDSDDRLTVPLMLRGRYRF